MKKENEIITEPDNLTEEQLEMVLGGIVEGMTTSQSVTVGTGKTMGIDAAGSSVFTHD